MKLLFLLELLKFDMIMIKIYNMNYILLQYIYECFFSRTSENIKDVGRRRPQIR